MNKPLKVAFQQEMQIAKSFYKKQNYRNAFQRLERAHILGQRYVLPHTVSHWWMMKVGWRQQDWREVSAQVPRLLASLLISKIWVPIGNTGGANVSPLKAMPVPEDLQELLKI